MGIESSIGFAGNRCALGITDRQSLRTALGGVADRHEGVHGLAGLAHRHHQGFRSDSGFAITKFVRELDRNGNTRPLLDRVGTEHRGIRSRATGNEDDARNLGVTRDERIQLGKGDHSIRSDTTAKCVCDRFRLFGDFLRHETRPATLFRSRSIPIDGELGRESPGLRQRWSPRRSQA